jgi:hypothetical protein
MSVTATPSNTPQSASNPTSALSSEQAIAASNQLRLFRLKNDRQFIEEAVAIPEPGKNLESLINRFFSSV